MLFEMVCIHNGPETAPIRHIEGLHVQELSKKGDQ